MDWFLIDKDLEKIVKDLIDFDHALAWLRFFYLEGNYLFKVGNYNIVNDFLHI